MAIYRTISLSFWTDTKIIDEFSPEDKYFYLYLLTNPHTNLCGCYEISKKQMCTELGYSIETLLTLLERFEKKLNVIRISHKTNEILLLNWYKYNWTTSPKFRKPLINEINRIKEPEFQKYLKKIEQSTSGYGIDTNCIDTTVTVTDTVIYTNNSNYINNSNTNNSIDIFSYIEELYGRTLNRNEYELISTWEDNDLTRYAIQKAIKNNVYNISYVDKIINSYKQKGYTSIENVEEEENKKLVTDDEKKSIEEIVKYLNEKTKSEYKSTARNTVKLIVDKLRQGFTIENFKKVIDNMTSSWLDSHMENSLRPETLFGDHFESYLNQKNIEKWEKPMTTRERNRKFIEQYRKELEDEQNRNT